MTEAQVEYVAETVKEIVRANRKDKLFAVRVLPERTEYDKRNGSNGATRLDVR